MQTFIVFVHWIDDRSQRNSLGRHIQAPHIDAACPDLEQHVRETEPGGIHDLWAEATGDLHP